MLRFIRQVVNETEDFSTVIIPILNNTTSLIILSDNNNNNTNSTISAFSFSSNKQGFSWEFNWNLILLLGLSLLFLTIIISTGIWYWYYRVHRLRREHSSPIAVSDFIETTNSINKPPPVPPRPTAYTTILGKVEYRSNL